MEERNLLKGKSVEEKMLWNGGMENADSCEQGKKTWERGVNLR